MGKLWGPHPATVRWLYEGIIKPSLTYGCLVWGHALKTKSILSKLHRLQRLALLPMSPVRSQTPTAGMEVLANITPLTITINELSIRTYLRIKSHLPVWYLFQIRRWVLGFGLDLENQDRIPPPSNPNTLLLLYSLTLGPPHLLPPTPFSFTLTAPKLLRALELALQFIKWTQHNALSSHPL